MDSGEQWAPGLRARRRDIILLGSTGSIGTQAADIIRRNPDRFRLTGLAAGGGNPALLAAQAIEFGVEVVAVASEAALPAGARGRWPARLGGRAGGCPRCIGGPDAVAELAARPCDVVLNAVTGAVGLAATLAALRRGPDAGAGQQGVADHGRPAGRGPGRARSDRPGRLRALGDRAVPAQRPGRARSQAGA